MRNLAAKYLLLELLKEMEDEFPGFVVESKAERWYWRALGFVVTCITLGKIDFIHGSMTTTLGNRIGFPGDLESFPKHMLYTTLMHERQHLRQFRELGFGSLWLGTAFFCLLYILLPLPLGLAYFRYRFEREAYEETIRAVVRLDNSEDILQDKVFKERIVSNFMGLSYGYMWPFRSQVEAWFDEALARILIEEGVVLVH